MYDLIFVGGGLASCLTALRITQRQPDLRLLILEHAGSLGGNHTWSFFPSDLSAEQLRWIDPLIAHRWSEYEVRFPARRRSLNTGYCSTNSEYFHARMIEMLGDIVRLNAEVAQLHLNRVTLRDGEQLDARCVIDGRGPLLSPHLMLGFQKFTGQVLELKQSHGLRGPIIMDATVPQLGDYRFLYTLPLSPTRLLVEDTRYSNSPALDTVLDGTEIEAYAAKQGWQVDAVIREEQGVLPITLGGDINAFWSDSESDSDSEFESDSDSQVSGIPRIGLRAALFHATTGYSFADAVRTADAIADVRITSTEAMFRFTRDRSRKHWRNQAYWRLLNRMLFIAADPNRRYVVMERFYGLNQSLIERFYAGASTAYDKLRILTGKPPVAILPALRCIPQNSAAKFSIEVTR